MDEPTIAPEPKGSGIFTTPLDALPDNLRQLGQEISQRHPAGVSGVDTAIKGKRGRKPFPRDASGNPIRPVQTESTGDSVPGQPISAPVAPPLDLKLIEECFRSILVTVDDTIKQSFHETTFKLTESATMADNIANKVCLKEPEKEMMPKLGALCCQQYNLAGQHAPIVFLGFFTLGYTVRCFWVARQLRAIARIAIAKRKKPETNSTVVE
jgi:hypothetical protein